MIGASCAANGAEVVDATGDADSVGIALSDAAGVGVTVVASSSVDEPFAITATAKITIPRITANITLFEEPEDDLAFFGAEYEDEAGFGVVEIVETDERDPLTGTGGTLYVEDFFAEERLAVFFAAFLTVLRAVDFFAEERLADLATVFFALFLAAFFGALRAVFFAATYLLLIYLCIAIDRLRFFKTS